MAMKKSILLNHPNPLIVYRISRQSGRSVKPNGFVRTGAGTIQPENGNGYLATGANKSPHEALAAHILIFPINGTP